MRVQGLPVTVHLHDGPFREHLVISYSLAIRNNPVHGDSETTA